MIRSFVGMGASRIVVAVATALAPTLANAGGGVLIVDSDNPDCQDTGAGTTEVPLCSVSAAFGHDSLAPGFSIQLRDSAVRYQAASTTNAPDGTADMPIVVEPFPGELPVIAGTLALRDVSHWHIHGLQFMPDEATIGSAISVEANALVEGVVVAENTIIGWSSGRVAIDVFSSNSGVDEVSALRVERNLVLGPSVTGIKLSGTADAVVERNVVRGLFCEPVEDQFAGIEVRGSQRAQVTRNQILDFEPLGCLERLSGILFYQGSDGRVDHNLVRGIEGGGAPRMGIVAGSSVSNLTVDHNIVERISDCGICLGVTYSGGGTGHRVVANTVLDIGEYAVDLSGSDNVAVFDNLLVGAGVAGIRDRPMDGRGEKPEPFTANHNLYWDTGDIGHCSGQEHPDLTSWQAGCGSDATGSVAADPLLPAQFAATDDFTPPTESPAVDVGVEVSDIIDAFSGLGVDLGALEAPIVLSAQIDEAAPTIVRLFVEVAQVDGLVFDAGCEGFAVAIDGEPVGVTACERVTELIEVELAEPAVEGQEVIVSYTGTHITDGAAIGGLIGARLQPFELVVDNGAPAGEADTGTDDDGTDDALDGTDPADAGDTGDSDGSAVPADSGCGCRSRPGSMGSAWALFLLGLAVGRRYSAADVSRANQRTL